MKMYFRNIILWLLVLICCDCSENVIRPEIRGFVFDKVTKLPIENAQISREEFSGQSLTETFTDKNGMFNLKMMTNRKLFDFEGGHDLKIYDFTVRHQKYRPLGFEGATRGSFGKDLIVYDSIYLLPK